MKQPRTSDFDPNAQGHELKSSMEDFPSIERPGRDVLPTTTGKRKIKSRHAFDIYEDQVEVLQKLSLEDRMRDGAGSMSAMVREALDDYIAKSRAE